MPTTTLLPSVEQQLRRLRALGLIDDVGELDHRGGEGLVAVHPRTASAQRLVEHIRLADKPGFVVPDMTDIAEFGPIAGLDLPNAPLYLVSDPQRGDELANWSPDEALPAILESGRSPMTIHEGLSWLLQQPEQLQRNHCFMTIGSRKPKGEDLDKRTPAIWISNGVQRDGGAARKGSAKVGWCWAGNRHTWLGFGSVAARTTLS